MDSLTQKKDPHSFPPFFSLRSYFSSCTSSSPRLAIISSSSATGSPKQQAQQHKSRRKYRWQPEMHIREERQKEVDEKQQRYQQRQKSWQQQQQCHQRQQQQVYTYFRGRRISTAVNNRRCQAICFAAAVVMFLAFAKCNFTIESPLGVLSITPLAVQAADFPSSVLSAASSTIHMQDAILADKQQNRPGTSFLLTTPTRRNLRYSAETSSFLSGSGQAPPRRLQAGIYTSDKDRARKGQVYLWLSVALVAILVMAIWYTLKIADVFDPLLHTRFTPSDRTR